MTLLLVPQLQSKPKSIFLKILFKMKIYFKLGDFTPIGFQVKFDTSSSTYFI